MLAVIGAGVSVWNVVTTTLRQSLAPDRMLGRVIGAHRLISWGGGALGAAAGAVVADAGGLRAPFLMAGALMMVLAAVAAAVLSRKPVPALA
jgi:hypothetical protein